MHEREVRARLHQEGFDVHLLREIVAPRLSQAREAAHRPMCTVEVCPLQRHWQRVASCRMRTFALRELHSSSRSSFLRISRSLVLPLDHWQEQSRRFDVASAHRRNLPWAYLHSNCVIVHFIPPYFLSPYRVVEFLLSAPAVSPELRLTPDSSFLDIRFGSGVGRASACFTPSS